MKYQGTVCAGHGMCVPGATAEDSTCTCEQGWAGITCESEDNMCAGVFCGHGECQTIGDDD